MIGQFLVDDDQDDWKDLAAILDDRELLEHKLWFRVEAIDTGVAGALSERLKRRTDDL